MYLSYDSTIPLLCIYSREVKKKQNKTPTYVQMFLAALRIIEKPENNTNFFN